MSQLRTHPRTSFLSSTTAPAWVTAAALLVCGCASAPLAPPEPSSASTSSLLAAEPVNVDVVSSRPRREDLPTRGPWAADRIFGGYAWLGGYIWLDSSLSNDGQRGVDLQPAEAEPTSLSFR